MITEEQRSKLEEKLSNGWGLPEGLFGFDRTSDIHDFMLSNYVYFLNNVNSRSQLLEGLEHLSPLADDALKSAKGMNEKDFLDFKIKLGSQREGFGDVPRRYSPIILPEIFVEYWLTGLGEKMQTPDGATILRMIEVGGYS